jgi:hypothetical protein
MDLRPRPLRISGMRRALLLAAAALLAAPALASADGLPVGNIDVGNEGVVVPGGSDRLVALWAGHGTTLVGRIDREGGQVLDSRLLREPLTIPGIALDGTADGLSADGRTLVLIRPRLHGDFPLTRTRLVVLDAKRLKVERRLTLKGDFSFDALSPDGRRLFLVNYVDKKDPRAYLVRSFDLVRGRFAKGAIVDAREPDEDMRGYPVTRVTTTGGRWAYTLYDGAGGEPFVHALDTVEGRAFCIDLPMLEGHEDPYRLRLWLREGSVEVIDGARRVAVIDTTAMHAREPAGLFAWVALLATSDTAKASQTDQRPTA